VCRPEEGEPEHDVPRLAAGAVDQPLALDQADASARAVDLLLPVDAGQLGGLAADQRAVGLAADLGRALDQLHDLLEVEPVRGHVVQEEERLRPGREHVVDAVRGQVAARVLEAPGPPREHELGADPVGGCRQQPPLVQRVKAGKGPEPLGAG
jgi:hypothetical protein